MPKRHKTPQNCDYTFSDMGSLCAPTSNFLGAQHSSCLYFGAIVSALMCKQGLLYFFGLRPTLSGRGITTKADALGANA